jgi:hypothetical protein
VSKRGGGGNDSGREGLLGWVGFLAWAGWLARGPFLFFLFKLFFFLCF